MNWIITHLTCIPTAQAAMHCTSKHSSKKDNNNEALSRHRSFQNKNHTFNEKLFTMYIGLGRFCDKCEQYSSILVLLTHKFRTCSMYMSRDYNKIQTTSQDQCLQNSRRAKRIRRMWPPWATDLVEAFSYVLLCYIILKLKSNEMKYRLMKTSLTWCVEYIVCVCVL